MYDRSCYARMNSIVSLLIGHPEILACTVLQQCNGTVGSGMRSPILARRIFFSRCSSAIQSQASFVSFTLTFLPLVPPARSSILLPHVVFLILILLRKGWRIFSFQSTRGPLPFLSLSGGLSAILTVLEKRDVPDRCTQSCAACIMCWLWQIDTLQGPIHTALASFVQALGPRLASSVEAESVNALKVRVISPLVKSFHELAEKSQFHVELRICRVRSCQSDCWG